MPILAGGVIVTTPEDVTPATPSVQPVWTEDIGSITATWIDPTGTEWPLSNTADDLGWFTMDGPSGWGASPIEIISDPLPRGGEQPRFIRSKPRRLQWPLYVGGDTHMQFVERWRRIMRAFTMTTQRRAAGQLRVARPGGQARTIACYYEQGFEGEAKEAWISAHPVIQLYCPDGYWSDVNAAEPVRAEFAAAATSYYSPFMTIGSSKVATGGADDPPVQILNPGDVEAWPTWTITGPMSKLTATNLTAGSRFALTYALPAGQTITITTNRPTVRGPGDLNFSRYVDWFNPEGTELWPLLDGLNEIRFQVDGAAAGTMIEMVYTPRYEAA